ncbi:MAG: 30S ribosomal protein S8 [Candidatus Aenigmarchaeota archaeon]|nr:30S ribosomal protein S8 [Candidatus Aenigmarchaeota archaeon]
MLQDPLADVLSVIKNADRVGKTSCITRASNEIKAVLKVLQDNGYIGAFELVDDGRGGKFKIELKGKILDTNVIKPRFSIALDEFEKWEKRYLPARNIGLLVLTTPKGIIEHKKAKELHVGGKLVCFVY